MLLNHAGVLLTGASGGIGHALAVACARQGARLVIVGRDRARTDNAARAARAAGATVTTVLADLSRTSGALRVVNDAHAALGAIDVVVNAAGVNWFAPFTESTPDAIERLVQVNLLAPMLLAHAALRVREPGRPLQIVNVGSTFGAVGFPFYAPYSASKFALRGFSEALRRELNDDEVIVTYVAPRMTRTSMNDGAEDAAAAIGSNVDEPDHVADLIVRAIEGNAAERHIGFPERLFARVNAALPQLIDRAVTKQGRALRPFAERSPTVARSSPVSAADEAAPLSRSTV